mgnify:CR=1 FL=1
MAVVGGAIAGATVGLLLAPEKGEDTRDLIVEYLKKKGIKLRRNRRRAREKIIIHSYPNDDNE